MIVAGTTWTEEEDQIITKMVYGGKSMAQIAAMLPGRSRNAVIGRYRRIREARGEPTSSTPRRAILETVSDDADRISPQLLRNTTPKRVCEPRRAMPKVAKVGVGFLLPALPARSSSPAVGILDVTGCRWPVGEDVSVAGRHTFCNSETDGSSYCAHHHELYKQKPVPKSEVKYFRLPIPLVRAGAA